MIAHASGAALEGRSRHRQPDPSGLCRNNGVVRSDWWALSMAGCLVAGAALAAEPAASGTSGAQNLALQGPFESNDGLYGSVLVGDEHGGDAAGMPVQAPTVGAGRIGEATMDGWDSFKGGPAAEGDVAAGQGVPWEAVGGEGHWPAVEPCGLSCELCHGPSHAAGYDFWGADGDPCHDGGRPGCLWAVRAEALVLWRNNIEGQPLLSGTDGSVALDAGDVRTAAAGGPRIGVVRSLGCGRALEGNYFNVGGIQGSTTTDGIGAPYTPIRLADIAFSDIQAAEYTTRGQIKSAEVNYRWCHGSRVIWLAGFRWVEWNEIGTVEMQTAGDNIQTRAGNDLYGGQLGCRLRLWDLGKWQLGAVGKAGVFGNEAYQQTTARVDRTFGPLGASDTNASFFGELGVNSTLWVTRRLAWRLGYNFFWLQGVATAAQQFPLVKYGTTTASINNNGSVFLQGFSTGLETRW
jgi:hypothetical protein